MSLNLAAPGRDLETEPSAESFEQSSYVAWVDAEFAQKVAVLLVVDLIGKLLVRLLDLLVVAPGPKQLQDLLFINLHGVALSGELKPIEGIRALFPSACARHRFVGDGDIESDGQV
jgi:hypothetical protein